MRLDLEQWRELAAPIYEVYPREPTENSGVNIEIGEAEGLFLSKVATPAQILIHDPAIRKNVCHDYLLFERFFEGGGQAEVGDIGFQVAPSRLHLIDMSQRYVSMKERSFSRGICIPHALLGYQRGEEPAFTSVELNSPKGRLLAAAHTELLNTQADRTAQDTALIAQTFIGLVRQLLLGPKPGHAPTDDCDLPIALLLQDYIAANLQDASLGVETLATAFGVSRATLYRHFEQEGGVARTIRNRRLDRCFLNLPVRNRDVVRSQLLHGDGISRIPSTSIGYFEHGSACHQLSHCQRAFTPVRVHHRIKFALLSTGLNGSGAFNPENI